MVNLTPVFVVVCCGYVAVASAQEPARPPVLTVCEALRDVNMYNGRDVVIVGRSSFTFDGSFLHEKREADDRILIQGYRWLSMIALNNGPGTPATQEVFPTNDASVREKLKHVIGYNETAEQNAKAQPDTGTPSRINLSEWVAVYGRIESPYPLKPPSSPSSPRNIPGNGYGANGTVPARIRIINSKTLGQTE